MIVGITGTAIARNRVVVVCQKHPKLMLTRLTAARQWQIERNSTGKQALWASVRPLCRFATGTEETTDMDVWIELTEVPLRG
jgi:hypothetical protein